MAAGSGAEGSGAAAADVAGAAGTAGPADSTGTAGTAGTTGTAARRRRVLAAVLGGVIVAGAGGWVAGASLKSPADAAAAHRPPPATPVTVPVVKRLLSSTVVANGTVQYASPQPIQLGGDVGVGDATGTVAQRVTKAPPTGTTVAEGDVLMEVSGRPVLVFTGTVPMYRTLGLGTTGDDVKQLQAALKRLGLDPGPVDGTFGTQTADAVRTWYRHKGYTAQEPTLAQAQQLASLRSTVQSAKEAKLVAQQAYDNATAAAATPATSATPGAPRATVTPTGGAAAGTGSHPGAGNRELLALQLQGAKDALDRAEKQLDDYLRGYGTTVPAGEAVFLPALPARLDKVNVKPGDTPAGSVATVTSSDLYVQASVPGVDAALLRRGMAVSIALPNGPAAQGVISLIGPEAAVSNGGSASRGSSGSAMTGASAGAPPAAAGGPDSGGAGSGGADSSGSNSGGSGAAPNDPNDPNAPVAVRVTAAKPAQLAGLAGDGVQMTVTVGASDGPVLAVPVAAVFTSADGQAKVRILRPDRAPDPVPVTLGLAADGYVEVKPQAGAALAEGDRVVVQG